MLFVSPDANRLIRLQGCFVSDKELEAIAGYWRGTADTDLDLEDNDVPWDGLALENEEDSLLSQAIELAQQSEGISTSFLQRRLHIGYPRAARLMQQLEEQGVVGPDPGGGRPRQVLAAIPEEEYQDSNDSEGEV